MFMNIAKYSQSVPSQDPALVGPPWVITFLILKFQTCSTYINNELQRAHSFSWKRRK